MRGRQLRRREDCAGWVVAAWRKSTTPKRISGVFETYHGALAYLALAVLQGERCAWIAFARDDALNEALMGEVNVAAQKRIYVVETNHQNGDASNGISDTVTTKLVKAAQPAQAIRHVAKGSISARVASQEDLVRLAPKCSVEEAGE